MENTPLKDYYSRKGLGLPGKPAPTLSEKIQLGQDEPLRAETT
jgi:hypothetical protein